MLRDHLHKLLGPEFVFINMSMDKDCIKKRLENRHGNSKIGQKIATWCFKYYEICTQVQEDEEKNSYNFILSEDMAPDKAARNLVKFVEKIYQK